MRKTRAYVVGLIVALPRITAGVQRRALDPVCDRIVEVGKRDGVLMGSLDLLAETLPPGAIVALYRLRVLTGQGNGPMQQRVDAAVDAIEAAGGKRRTILWEVDPALNRRSDTAQKRDIMLRAARDEIQRAKQGDDGGAPKRFPLSDEQKEVLKRHWKSMEHPRNIDAKRAIEAEAREKGLPYIGGLSVASLINLLGASGRARLRRERKPKAK